MIHFPRNQDVYTLARWGTVLIGLPTAFQIGWFSSRCLWDVSWSKTEFRAQRYLRLTSAVLSMGSLLCCWQDPSTSSVWLSVLCLSRTQHSRILVEPSIFLSASLSGMVCYGTNLLESIRDEHELGQGRTQA